MKMASKPKSKRKIEKTETTDKTEDFQSEETDGTCDEMEENVAKEEGLFPVLNPNTSREILKKQRFVPEWIENASSVSRDIHADKCDLSIFADFLSKITTEQLREQEISHLFPVQKALIPELISPFLPQNHLKNRLPPRDICVSTPTGSGKTLCYVLPIVEFLIRNLHFTPFLHRIRALIILPVVELAKQVYEVFRIYTQNTRIKTVLLTGKQDLDSEIRTVYEKNAKGRGYVATPEIVVATPGRLLEHLQEAGQAFSLKYLRFLVVDEADRLLNDYRMEWLKALDASVYGETEQAAGNKDMFFGEEIELDEEKETALMSPPLPHRTRPNFGGLQNLFDAGQFPLQKIFLSATLSYDPGQLQRLNLFKPKLFRAKTDGQTEVENVKNFLENSEGEVVLPSDLKEIYIRSSSNSKPLSVFVLLKQQETEWKRVLCFVKSRQASRRLAYLLNFLGLERVKEASAALSRSRREKLIKNMNTGKIRILICSDLMARGVDISDVDCVINYDPPREMRSYVHRAGRTARAGRAGTVVTIVDEEAEMQKFQKIMETYNRWSSLICWELSKETLQEHKMKYRDALQQLKTVVNATSKRKTVKQGHKRKQVADKKDTAN